MTSDAGQRARGGPTGWQRGFRVAQWIVIPALVFASLEFAVRRAERSHTLPVGWNWPDFGGQKVDLDCIFLGSSRVAAAVDQGEFERRLNARLDRPVRAMNLGHGWSYLVQNYLCLRNLLDANAEILRGAVVLIELPGGLLAFEGQRWSGRWFEPDYAYQLVTLLRRQDMPRLWSSRMSLDDKLRMTFGWAARRCHFLTRRAAIGHFVRQQAERKAAAWCEPYLAPAAPRETAGDLTTAVGIRAEQTDIQRARRLAVQVAKQAPAPEPSERQGDRVIDDLVALVQRAGGKVFFFEMPLHSVQSAGHKTDDWQARRTAFAQWAAERDVPILVTDFQSVDDDFPDMWHLRQSRSADFTCRLAESFSRQIVERSMYGPPILEMTTRPSQDPDGRYQR